MNEFLAVIGWFVLVIPNAAFTLTLLAALRFGGGDMGPLFGDNWYRKGARLQWFLAAGVNALFWYGIALLCPLSVTIGVQ